MPIVRYSNGSYFGDEDILCDIESESFDVNKKVYRETTVDVMEDSELYVIKKR